MLTMFFTQGSQMRLFLLSVRYRPKHFLHNFRLHFPHFIPRQKRLKMELKREFGYIYTNSGRVLQRTEAKKLLLGIRHYSNCSILNLEGEWCPGAVGTVLFVSMAPTLHKDNFTNWSRIWHFFLTFSHSCRDEMRKREEIWGKRLWRKNNFTVKKRKSNMKLLHCLKCKQAQDKRYLHEESRSRG